MRLVLPLLFFCLTSLAAAADKPEITPATAGPYHVEAKRIVDARKHTFLVRGTEMPPLTLKDEDFSGDGREFGPYSPSSFITIRQRLNMNAIRLPVNARLYAESEAYQARLEQAVRLANRFELLVILASDAETTCASGPGAQRNLKEIPTCSSPPRGRTTRPWSMPSAHPVQTSRSFSPARFAMPTPFSKSLRVTLPRATMPIDGANSALPPGALPYS
jgi:hypothetical protein